MSKIKRIYIFNECHLPDNGWLQGCFKCDQITSKVTLFKTFHKDENLYEFYVYTCGKCKKNFKKLDNDWLCFNNSCNKYIKDYFGYLLTGRT
jgi:hypothetical protein